MTDRYNYLTVVLEHDTRDDDAEGILSAIRHIVGVADVSGNVTDPMDYVAQTRARQELEEKLWKALRDE